MVNISWVVQYLWIIPAIFMILSLALLSSPKREYRLHGYSWLMWTGIILLVWCACGYCQYWYLGLIGILYALWGYARNKPQEPTAQELEEEAGVKVPGYE